MRCISPHLGYSLQVFEPSETIEHDGVTGKAYSRVDRPALVADFDHGGLFPHEVEYALTEWEGDWKGIPEGVNPATRISLWDTEAMSIAKGWDEVYLAAVDARLRFLETLCNGRFRIIEDLRAPRPFPKYDLVEEEAIPQYLAITGISAEIALRYENEKAEPRPWLVAQLEDMVNLENQAIAAGEPVLSV